MGCARVQITSNNIYIFNQKHYKVKPIFPKKKEVKPIYHG